MPHLITIIKYARNIVKYILVLLSALSEKTHGLASRTVQVFHFVWITNEMGSFCSSRKMGLAGIGASG
jgi:hypothetical protein